MRLNFLKHHSPPRLVWVLVAINSVLLALPLLGVGLLRVYESALVRQTESELMAQGVVIAAAARALSTPPVAPPLSTEPWQPHLPTLDLATSPVLSPLATPEPYPGVGGQLTASQKAWGAQVTPILRQSQFHTLAALRVTDARGVIVAATNGELIGLSLHGHQEVQSALRGRFTATLRARQENERSVVGPLARAKGLRVVVAVPIDSASGVIGVVELLRTPPSLAQSLWAKRWSISKALFCMLLVVAGITWLLLRLILQPLSALNASAREAASGRPYVPPPHRGLAEFETLACSVAHMAEALQMRSSYIRDFAAHVSHEFKTPLSGILASTELLRDHPEMGALQQERFIKLIESEAQRLHRLTQRLLELARAETVEPGGQVALLPLLRSLCLRYQDHGKQVNLLAERDLTLPIPSEMLDSCLSTLIDNAFEHGGADAQVTLECTTTGLWIKDNGSGISAANAQRLFTPFFTTARDRGRTGLGLAIARALLRAHGGDLYLHSAQPCVFVLSWPSKNKTPRNEQGVRGATSAEPPTAMP